MSRYLSIGFGLLGGLLALGGCNRDPYQRADVWKPTGANAANMAAMVANPHDFMQGRSASGANAKAPASAVDRIWSDQPRGFSGGGGSGAAGGSPGGGGPSGGAGGGSGGGGGTPGS